MADRTGRVNFFRETNEGAQRNKDWSTCFRSSSFQLVIYKPNQWLNMSMTFFFLIEENREFCIQLSI